MLKTQRFDTFNGSIYINAGASNNNLYIKSTDATSGISLSDNGGSINLATTSSGAFRVMTGGTADTAADDSAISMLIDSTGAMTKPLQPAFNARQSSAQINLDINAGSAITIVMATEIFDQNADYNTSTSTFTAPVTGRYQLNFHTYMTDVDDDFAYLQLDLVTSNRQYNIILENSGEDGYDNFSISVLADMDASDTALVQIQGSGGADQLDLSQSVFSGFLAC
jgi:hypothetical protein